MDKQKLFALISKIYEAIMVFIFTAFSIAVTKTWSQNGFVTLKNRFFISFIFLVIGCAHLIFKNKLIKLYYEREGLGFKDGNGRQKALNRIVSFGRSTCITGVAIIVVSLILFFYSEFPR